MDIRLTKREKQVLIELVKDSKISDQEIARKIKTSRPTVFKIRKRLEKEGVIRGYVGLIDFERLGFSVQAAILYRWRDYSKSSELEKNIKFVKSLPQVILFIKGEGLGKTDLIISMHKDLKDYEGFIRRLKYEWKDNVEGIEVFLSSIEGMFKNYDLVSCVKAKIEENVIFLEK